jgi:hypothetical protein
MDSNGDRIEDTRTEPVLTPIKNGWAARGKGWAVHGRTKEEAIQNYYEAEERRREINQRGFWYERHRQDSLQDENG